MKKKMMALAALLAPAAVFAEGNSYSVPSDVTDAITTLKSAATAYSAEILPYITAVGLAFIGIAVIYLLFRVFKKFVGGK